MVGKALLFAATIALLHAAYSAYEHLSILKALGKPEDSLPASIVLEALGALILGTLGASLSIPELKEISWRSEMKTRTLEEMNTRLGFADWGAQAKNRKERAT
jgi:hypothetical protein